MSLPKLHPLHSIPETLPTWVDNFRLLVDANQWDPLRAKMVLLISVDIEFHPLVNNSPCIDSALHQLIQTFFPAQDFFKYEKKISESRSFHFRNINEYLKNLRLLSVLANFCTDKNNHLVQREMETYFMNGLTQEERNFVISSGEINLDKASKKLDEASFLRLKFSGTTKPTYKNTNKYQNKPGKWCSFHSTNSHSDQECIAQK